MKGAVLRPYQACAPLPLLSSSLVPVNSYLNVPLRLKKNKDQSSFLVEINMVCVKVSSIFPAPLYFQIVTRTL